MGLFRSIGVLDACFVFPLGLTSEINADVELLLSLPDTYPRDLFITKSPVCNSRLVIKIGTLMVVLSKISDREGLDFEAAFK